VPVAARRHREVGRARCGLHRPGDVGGNGGAYHRQRLRGFHPAEVLGGGGGGGGGVEVKGTFDAQNVVVWHGFRVISVHEVLQVSYHGERFILSLRL